MHEIAWLNGLLDYRRGILLASCCPRVEQPLCQLAALTKRSTGEDIPGHAISAILAALITCRHMPVLRQQGKLHARPTGFTTHPPSGMPSHMSRR
jgi:hypothetical protein